MASPAARVRAHELGIDLATLKGSGPGGVIVLGDVEGHGAGTPTPTRGGNRNRSPPAPRWRRCARPSPRP
jgi:pyruvate dehydrogenase E2 component (dihydrolipoamide acetyltransferase)